MFFGAFGFVCERITRGWELLMGPYISFLGFRLLLRVEVAAWRRERMRSLLLGPLSLL